LVRSTAECMGVFETLNMTQHNLDSDNFEPSPSAGWIEVFLIMHCEPGYRGGDQ